MQVLVALALALSSNFRYFRSAALAWDNDGHASIGMAAMSGIKGDALTQLKRLLNGRDAVDVAGWGHKLATKYPGMEPIFYQIEQREAEDRNCSNLMREEYVRHPTCIEDQGCLLNAIQDLYATLTNTAGGQHTKPLFKWPVRLKMTDADNVKLLIHLIGDLHQPLRVGFSFNHGGKDTEINYLEKGRKTNTTLFNYWETDLIQKMIRERPNFWFSGWTHVNNLGRATVDAESKAWDNAENKSAIFQDWFEESRGYMCKRVMQPWRPVNAQNRQTEEPETWIMSGYEIPQTTLFVDFEFAKSRLLLAGARTSIVLNSILASRDAKKLRRGSGVLVAHEAEYRVMLPGAAAPQMVSSVSQRSGSRWIRNLSMNVMIVAVVLAGFILASRLFPFSGVTAIRALSPGTRNTAGKKVDPKFS